MTKVVLNQVTPTDEIIKNADDEFSVTDARGRIISLKKPNALAQLRFVKALGKSNENESYKQMVAILTFVSKIDGDPVPQFINEASIEGLWGRLDTDGLEAIALAIQGKFGEPQTVEETLAEIKK